MQAICDHDLNFEWVEIKWPGATSDYMAWICCWLCKILEDNIVTKILLDGFTIVGDNAYVKKKYMAVPLKGTRCGHEDAYNFYLLQLRITIERAFGVLVHRWVILRAPLVVPLPKVTALVESLIRLHNFCIGENDTIIPNVDARTSSNLNRNVRTCNIFGAGGDYDVVELDDIGRPVSLLNYGLHFNDAEHHRLQDDETPMDRMIDSCLKQGLKRPKY